MEPPSPSPSTSTSKVEVIKQAIKQVMEEVGGGTKSSSDDSDNDNDGGVEDANHHHHRRRRLLSKLMSQLENLEAEPEAFTEGLVSKSDFTSNDETTKVKRNVSGLEEEDREDRLVKELKKVKRQNFITHCLLSAMILLTVTWQISEVSIILKLKDGVSHPFRSIGYIFKRMLTPPKANGSEEETESSITSNLIESSPVHDFKIPEFPRVELPKINFGVQDED